MKTIKFALLVAAVALSTTACKKNQEPAPQPAGSTKVITVTPSLYSFSRATDTAFEEGDAIGLHVVTTASTWLDNAKYTFTGGKLVGVTTNEWYDDENLVADVMAYYPYKTSGAYNANGYTFTVNADQSSAANYTASDLMVAYTTSKPTKDAVVLPFKHALSKVVVNVDNQLGEDIAAVWFSDIYGTATVNFKSGSVTTSGSAGTIKAAKANGSSSWSLIVAPQQNVSPKLIVTTVGQKQFTFSLNAPVTFTSGKVSTANVSLTKESISTSFTPEISDWVADNELQFGQPAEGEAEDDNQGEDATSTPSGYNLIGTIGGDNWTTNIPMYVSGNYFVTKNVALVAGDQFKIRKGDAWDESYGTLSKWENETSVPYAAGPFCPVGDANITVSVAGNYDIYIKSDFSYISLIPAGGDIATEMASVNLGVIGNGDWNSDIAKFVFEGEVFVAKGINFASEFKIRKDDGWNDDWGLANASVSLTPNIKQAVAYKGANIPAPTPLGTYDLYFDGRNIWLQ